MLKKISVSAILLFTISTVIAQDQKDVLTEFVDNIISIEDARSKLEEEVEAINQERIKITTTNTQHTKEDGNDNGSKALALPPVSTRINKDSLKIKLNNLLNTSYFNQYLKPSYSRVGLPYLLSNISEIINIPLRRACSYNSIDIIIHKVYYSDGTIDELYNKVPLYKYYTNAKCIDSLQMEVIVNYPANIQQVSLSKKNPTFGIGNNYVQLISMKDKEAEIFLSENVYENLKTIQAKSKEGMVLDYVSDDIRVEYPPAVSAFYQKMVLLCKAIIKDIDKGKYDSLDNLKRDIVDKLFINFPKHTQDCTIELQFEKSINQIDVYYAAEQDSVKVFGTLINGNLQSAKNPYHTAFDSDMDQFGIVDNSGNWIVEPQYYFLEHIDSLFFRGNKIEDNKDNGYQTYKLDVDAKALIQYEYSIVDTLSGKYYLISTYENIEEIGVMDKNGNIIIAPTKGQIRAPFPGFFTVKDTLAALYDGEGKILLPQRYSLIRILDEYIYATQYIESRRIRTIYDLNMRQITKDNWDAQTAFKNHSDLVVVEDENGDAFYINNQGEIIIPPTSEYVFLTGFCFGSALVFTGDYSNGTIKYGYINDKGHIIIEPQYDRALPFQGEYAYIEKNGEPMLIDKSNTIYKKLPSASTLSSWRNLSDTDPADTRYYLENEMVLDGYGNEVKDMQ
ncbi:WG repeat-containing protein [Dysgonomonas sp. GY617]|uniref:WG repeat-containing protein n=1 Tax=Dysgonomonas sp. GY617 TaxID=2780420 RepID=UPI0018834E9B|nr:WG repeat-containing protein [Dysgonomonas sp. GY617]MBF0575508.1 WG repeat-containing protein [Dysgonomonas sp. GY617]